MPIIINELDYKDIKWIKELGFNPGYDKNSQDLSTIDLIAAKAKMVDVKKWGQALQKLFSRLRRINEKNTQKYLSEIAHSSIMEEREIYNFAQNAVKLDKMVYGQEFAEEKGVPVAVFGYGAESSFEVHKLMFYRIKGASEPVVGMKSVYNEVKYEIAEEFADSKEKTFFKRMSVPDNAMLIKLERVEKIEIEGVFKDHIIITVFRKKELLKKPSKMIIRIIGSDIGL